MNDERAELEQIERKFHEQQKTINDAMERLRELGDRPLNIDIRAFERLVEESAEAAPRVAPRATHAFISHAVRA
jgi:hypothetical protein